MKYSKNIEKIKDKVKISKNWSDLCRNLEISSNPGNRRRLRNIAKTENIDCSHFHKKWYHLIDISEFELVIKNNVQIKAVLKHFKIDLTPSNYRNFHKLCISNNIDTSHLLGNVISRGKEIFVCGEKHIISNINVKYSEDEIFCENSKYKTTSRLRILYIDKNKYECEICQNDGTHLGKKLTLQLDHINGISNDNRIENLRLLCPNCHSQTDTYGSKNISYNKNANKNANKCRKCDSKISNHSNNFLCIKCSNVNTRKFDPSKKELLRKIKELKYMTRVGKFYGVSDNAIRKRCKLLGIQL